MSKRKKKKITLNKKVNKLPYVKCKIEIRKSNNDKLNDLIYYFKFDKGFINLFICLLLSESIFNVIGFGVANFFTFIRIFSFTLLNTSLICLLTGFIKKKKVSFIIRFIVLIFFDIYALVELQFKNFMEMYYSFISVSEGGLGKIKNLIVYFIASIKPYYFLCLLPIFLFIIIDKKYYQKDRLQIKSKLITILASTIILLLSFNAGSSIDLKENYLTHKDIETTFANFGIEHTFLRDIVAIKYIKEEKIEITTVEEEKVITSRTINDTDWKDLIEQEENENIKEIDNYLISRNVSDFNEMTGIYKDYNFIYILVESLDYLAIDEDLTPTLYKMFEEGISFRNHYTPIYTCCTGDSDMMSLNSLMPLGSSCTYYTTQTLTYGSGLGNLFQNMGYDTYAFHNWTDEFYERSLIYPNSGFDEYYDYHDLDYKAVAGWPQDSQMFDLGYDVIRESDKFFAYFVTSTMHFPFNTQSYTGQLYLDLVDEKYPDYPIEIKRYISKSMDFDRGLENLLNRLEEDGKLDNTVICFYPDHYPYIFGQDLVLQYGNNVIDRLNVYDGKDLSPFIIYNANSEPLIVNELCSTIDHVPTIANMFGLNYDPRLYMGNDIFSSDCTVIYNNGSFMNKYGTYSSSTDVFTLFEDKICSESYISLCKQTVKNKMAISKSIINNDYFKYRKNIVNAVYED